MVVGGIGVKENWPQRRCAGCMLGVGSSVLCLLGGGPVVPALTGVGKRVPKPSGV